MSVDLPRISTDDLLSALSRASLRQPCDKAGCEKVGCDTVRSSLVGSVVRLHHLQGGMGRARNAPDDSFAW